MLGTEESEELRALQRKAYGRQGGLTRTEASRLGELQKLREVPDTAHDLHTDEPSLTETLGFEPDAPAADVEPVSEPVAEGDVPAAEGDADDSEGQDASLRASLRRYWRPAAVGCVAVLAIGIGVGWALFGARASGPQLTAEQQQRGAEIAEKGDFDPGSFRALGRDEEAVAWYGTKDNGRLTCISLLFDEQTDTQCTESSGLETFGLSAQVMTTPTEDEDGAVLEAESMGVYVAHASNGDPVAIFQRWTSSGSMVDQFSGDERTRAEELVAEGFNGNLAIVGYFRDLPVWAAERYAEDSIEAEMCLFVDGVEGVGACAPVSEAHEAGLTLSHIEPLEELAEGIEGGELVSVTTFELRYTQFQGPFLTITNDPNVTTAVFEYGDGDDDGN